MMGPSRRPWPYCVWTAEPQSTDVEAQLIRTKETDDMSENTVQAPSGKSNSEREQTRPRMPRTERVADRVFAYRTIDSTNVEARRLLLDGTLRPGHGSIAVIAADMQSAGRGRLDHTWVSRPGESFAVTFVVSVPRGLATDGSVNGWLQMIAGLAAIDGLRGAVRQCGAEPVDGESGCMLKWPNDIFIGDRKLGGILSEMAPLAERAQADDDRIAIIFGIGLNLAIAADRLPTPQATSLQLHYAPLPEAEELRDSIAAGIAESLQRRLHRFESNPETEAHALRDETERICYTLGRHAVAHFVDGSEMEGEAVALNADASLDLRASDGAVHTIRTADVGVLPNPCV